MKRERLYVAKGYPVRPSIAAVDLRKILVHVERIHRICERVEPYEDTGLYPSFFENFRLNEQDAMTVFRLTVTSAAVPEEIVPTGVIVSALRQFLARGTSSETFGRGIVVHAQA